MLRKTNHVGVFLVLACFGAMFAGQVFMSPSSSPNHRLTRESALRGSSPLKNTVGSRSMYSSSAAWCGAAGILALSIAGYGRSSGVSGRKAFDPAAQEGVTEPFGFFDPLGFSKGKDEAGFRNLRVAEIKHGRVAMMASVGMVLPHFWKAPGFQDVPSGIGAVFTNEGGAGFAALFLGAGFHELVLWKDDASKDAGDFGDPFSFGKDIVVDRNYEINNGRMAMFAVIGQIVAELVTGKDAVEQLML